MRTLFTAAGLGLLIASAVHAHGGIYVPPLDGGTPGAFSPVGGTTPGQPNPGNPNPGGGGGGTTPINPGGTSPDPGGGSAPVRPGVGGVARPSGGRGFGRTTGRRKKSKGAARNLDWDWWWDLNEERFLNLKKRVRSRAAASDNGDFVLGGTLDDDTVVEVTMSQIRNEILPALKTAARDRYYDTRAAAVIALGKSGLPSDAELVDTIAASLKDDDRRVRESACLGLGLLGNEEAVGILIDVARNTSDGKRLCGRGTSDVLTRTRSFASVALGLIGARRPLEADGRALKSLMKSLATHGRQKDLQIGPALAFQAARAPVVIPELLRIVSDVEQDGLVRAQAAIALGKSGASSAVGRLRETLRDKSRHLARSSAIALGLLVERDDTATVAQIARYARSASDRGTRNFCIMALAEIGGGRAQATLTQLATRGRGLDRSFGALGLGVMAFNHNEGKAEVGRALMKLWSTTKSDRERGAIAIGLGLASYEPARAPLREALDRGGSQELKGHVCTALGLMDDKDAIPAIQTLVAQRGDPDLRKRAAIALGLLRDTEAVTLIQRIIEESTSSKGILGAATIALGHIGDRSALPTLLRFVDPTNEDNQDVTRAFATVALGYLGDKDEIPLLSRIHENTNYLGATDAMAELLTIL